MKAMMVVLMLVISSTSFAAGDKCSGSGCLNWPIQQETLLENEQGGLLHKASFIPTASNQGFRCAAECGDGSDVHGTFRDSISGYLSLEKRCKNKGGLKEGSFDCSDSN